jgi:hypothetical protein
MCVRLSSRYDNTFRKRDLPERKNPEIQDPDTRLPGCGKVTNQSALRADAVEISALAINICCYNIGALEKEHEQACHDRNHHESEHL